MQGKVGVLNAMLEGLKVPPSGLSRRGIISGSKDSCKGVDKRCLKELRMWFQDNLGAYNVKSGLKSLVIGCWRGWSGGMFG